MVDPFTHQSDCPRADIIRQGISIWVASNQALYFQLRIQMGAESHLETIVDVEQVVGVRAGISEQLGGEGPHSPVRQLMLLVGLHRPPTPPLVHPPPRSQHTPTTLAGPQCHFYDTSTPLTAAYILFCVRS